MKYLLVLSAALLAITVSGAGAGGALQAGAEIENAGGEVIGFAKFTEDATGIVHVNVHAKGLSPGLHGIHIHTVGACAPTFLAAGGHHNPPGHQPGLDNPNGAHAGDLPNLTVNEKGVGHLNATTDRATLSAGPTTVFDADGS